MFPLGAVSRPNSLPLPFQKPALQAKVNFDDRKKKPFNKRKENKRILPFVTQFQPSVPNLKQILMSKWHLITNQPLLKEIFEEPPLPSSGAHQTRKGGLYRIYTP